MYLVPASSNLSRLTTLCMHVLCCRHPMKYASMLAEKMKEHGTKGWLVNTGWTGGSYGVGSRISLKYTRAIIDAIHSGVLDNVAYAEVPLFNLQVRGQSGL